VRSLASRPADPPSSWPLSNHAAAQDCGRFPTSW
jgi:hypothetical protein